MHERFSLLKWNCILHTGSFFPPRGGFSAKRTAVETLPFARARRYLDYDVAAKWTALVAAVASGIFYVALLAVLGLFADLIFLRGQIPPYSELRNWERDIVAVQWGKHPDPESSLARYGVEPARITKLVETDPANLTKADWETIWQTSVFDLLDRRISNDAAEIYWQDRHPADGAEEAETGRGILSLTVRSRNDWFFGPLLGAVARWNPWMWKYGQGTAPNSYYLTGLLLLAIVLSLLEASALFVMHDGAARATSEASRRLRRAVYHHTYRLGTLAVKALGPAEATSIFTRHIEAVHDALYAWMTVRFREPVKFFLLLAFALVLNVWLALSFVTFALLIWLFGGQLAAYFRRQGRVAEQRAATHLALLQESLMLMRLVKVYLMELFNQARVERQLSSYVRCHLSRYRGDAIYRTSLIFLGTLAALLLLFVTGRIVLRGELGVASVTCIVTALVSLYWPLFKVLESRRILRRGAEAAGILFRFLDRPSEVGQAAGAQSLPGLSKQIEFRNVSLIEQETNRQLLQNVDLTIAVGERVALVGFEEYEKHALVYLIPRFLDPTSGEIFLDQHDLRWVTLDSLRSQIALVLQHNLVFNDTVANNIGCGDTSYTLPQIIEAAKLAHAHHFVSKLPRGYETPIGELGHALRIGEQFRIALARAVLRDPALLIVEEPVEALDDDTKAMLDDTFARILPGRTAIFLPHRMSTIRSCDRVYFLHKGRIAASGDHRELLSQNELYRHLSYLEFNVYADLAKEMSTPAQVP